MNQLPLGICGKVLITDRDAALTFLQHGRSVRCMVTCILKPTYYVSAFMVAGESCGLGA